MSAGIHALRVSKEGYRTATEQVEVEGDETHPPLTIELVATAGFLSLESDPAEATVTIDGEEVGPSPVEDFVLEPGAHEIRVEKRGFQNWSMEVQAEAGESLSLVARLGKAPAAPVPPPTVASTTPVEPVSPEETLPVEPEVLEISAGITPPRKLSGDTPNYPPMAKQMDQEGTVSIRLIVTEDGQPIELEVVESAGPILDGAVMRAVRSWTFEPAKKDGAPVRVYFTVRQTFRIGS